VLERRTNGGFCFAIALPTTDDRAGESKRAVAWGSGAVMPGAAAPLAASSWSINCGALMPGGIEQTAAAGWGLLTEPSSESSSCSIAPMQSGAPRRVPAGCANQAGRGLRGHLDTPVLDYNQQRPPCRYAITASLNKAPAAEAGRAHHVARLVASRARSSPKFGNLTTHAAE
jgi:hypothetical protein